MTPPKTKPEAATAELGSTEAEPAEIDEVAADARDTAEDQAVKEGKSQQEAERIGRVAAEHTYRLFERSGAFRREEPAPPPPPPAPAVETEIDDAPKPAPTGSRGFAARFLGGA